MFNARGFRSHEKRCSSRPQEPLPAVGFEGAAHQEDGRFHTHLGWPKIYDKEVKDHQDLVSLSQDIDEQPKGLEGFSDGNESGEFVLQVPWLLIP